jgi:hypothetical protein
VLTALLARQWLSATWSIAAGLLLALVAAPRGGDEHLVVGSVVRVLPGRGVVCLRAWVAKQAAAWFVLAGIAFGYAYLVNPLVLLFPPCLALLMFVRGARVPAALLLGVFLLPVVAMGIRNAHIDGAGRGTDRALLNFVQGSWPDYHQAANLLAAGRSDRGGHHARYRRRARHFATRCVAGLARMGERMADNPAMYLKWYAPSRGCCGVGASGSVHRPSPITTCGARRSIDRAHCARSW